MSYTIATRGLTGMMTEAQARFIQNLLGTRDVPGGAPEVERIRGKLTEGEITKQQASDMIGWLKTLPIVSASLTAATPGQPSAPADPVTEEGLYLHDDRVYKVQRSKTSGRLYAKVLTVTIPEARRLTEAGEVVNFDYTYAPGAFRVLSASDRLTAERAESLSIVYSWCIRCGRALKRAESVQAGMGPVCRNKV